VATLDYLSQGRFFLGVGFGYNRQEVEDHGVAASDRRMVVEETVRLMRSLWVDEIAEFAGRHRHLSPSKSWPKPARAGGPPVLLGAKATPRNLDRVVAWADGWIPAGIGVTSEDFAASVHDLRARWDDAGRRATPEVCCFFAPGSRDEMATELDRAAELGVQRMQLRVDERGRDQVLPILDELARALDR
jgi:alkanesulfonate monooxygenase SsuD/methylene tetrahydromethanopterin reductase-like flavin-dependent oxidoreductase (luciferase family)